MITFSVDFAAHGDEKLFVIGSSPKLGSWDLAQAVPLEAAAESRAASSSSSMASKPKLWRVDVTFTAAEKGNKIDYKYFARDGTAVRWETAVSGNRSLVVPVDGAHEKFDGAFEGGDGARAARPLEARAIAGAAATTPAPQRVAPAPPSPRGNDDDNSGSYSNNASTTVPTTTAVESNRPIDFFTAQAEFQNSILEVVYQTNIVTDGLIHCLALHPVEKKFALGLNSRAQVWEYDDERHGGGVVFSSNAFDCAVTCVALSTQSVLACGLACGDVWIMRLSTSNYQPFSLRGKHDKEIRSLAFHAQLPWLASGGADATIRMWDLDTHVPLFVLMAHRYAVLSLSFAAHCADVLVSGSADHSIRLWDCSINADAARTARATSGGATVTAAAASGTSDLTAAASVRCLVALSTASVALAHSAPVVWATMPRGDLLLSAGADGCLKAWTLSGVAPPVSATAIASAPATPAASSATSAASPTSPTSTTSPSVELESDQLHAPPPPAGPPARDAYVDVIDVASFVAPNVPSTAQATTMSESNYVPHGPSCVGGGLLARGGASSLAAVFANATYGVVATVTVSAQPDGPAPRVQPTCYTVLSGTGPMPVLVDPRAARSSLPGPVSPPPVAVTPVTLAAALFCVTHASLPHIVTLHGDKSLRVLSASTTFDQLRTVQSATVYKASERIWLARIDRNVPVKTLAMAFATFVDRLGFAVYQAGAKGAFIARMKLVPTCELRLCVGLDVVGRRVLQATFDDERDAAMFREMLNSFALFVLARRDWLSTVTWRRSDAVTNAPAAAASGSCVIV